MDPTRENPPPGGGGRVSKWFSLPAKALPLSQFVGIASEILAALVGAIDPAALVALAFMILEARQ